MHLQKQKSHLSKCKGREYHIYVFSLMHLLLYLSKLVHKTAGISRHCKIMIFFFKSYNSGFSHMILKRGRRKKLRNAKYKKKNFLAILSLYLIIMAFCFWHRIKNCNFISQLFLAIARLYHTIHAFTLEFSLYFTIWRPKCQNCKI